MTLEEQTLELIELGIRGEHVPFLLKQIARYDRECPGCEGHLGGPVNPN